MDRRSRCKQSREARVDLERVRAVDLQLVEAGMGHVEDEVSLVRDHGVGHLLSSVSDPDHIPLFEDLGVHRVESPHQLSGEQFSRAVAQPHVRDFMSLGNGAEIAEIVLEAGAPLAEKLIGELGKETLPDDVILVAIERGDGLLVPKGDTTLQSGDVVTVFSLRGITDDLMRSFEAD